MLCETVSYNQVMVCNWCRPSMADNNDGDNPEQLEVLQTLQEMLVRITHIEVRIVIIHT